MRYKPLLTLLALTCSFWALSSNADQGQFYLAPGLQKMNFDDSTDLDHDWGGFVGFGYDFTDRLSVELSSFDLDPDTPLQSDFDIDHYKLDLLYDVGGKLGDFQPFVLAGLGNTNFDGEHDTTFDLGGGFKYEITDNLEWRTALRSFNYLSRDHEDGDFGIDTALVFYFGGNSRSSAAPRRETGSRTAEPAREAERVAEPAREPDTDGDGVPDSRDACEDTPRNYAVDARGCPIPVEEVARVELLVNFDFDRSEVKPEYFSEIEEVADFMRQYPDVVVELEGHTDSRGTEEYNRGLSDRRANAVRQVLIDRFNVQGSRITARGFGESQPVASNDTDSGRARNRRTMTVIIKTLQNYRPR